MTTYNTGNPIGSTEVKDLYDNAQNFDTLSTTTTLETVPDRLGVPRMSLHGFEEEAKRRFESIKFQAPIPYAPGIEVTTSSLTVDYLGVLYYALPSVLPFTTGAWNPAQWSPLQNTYPGNELLVFDDYASASAAAATLPDLQKIEAPNTEGRLSRFTVQSGELVFKDFVPDSIRMQSYTELRAYTGKQEVINITSIGIAGRFVYDQSDNTSLDDNGIVIVGAGGRRWKRIYDGKVNVLWFGAKAGDNSPDVAAANTAAFRAACLSMKSAWTAYAAANKSGRSVFVPDGDYNLSNGFTVPKGCSLTAGGLGGARLKILAATVDANPKLPLVSLGRCIDDTTLQTETTSGAFVQDPPPYIGDIYLNPQNSNIALDITNIPGFAVGDLWVQAGTAVRIGGGSGDGIFGKLFLEDSTAYGVDLGNCQNIILPAIYTFVCNNPVVVTGNCNNIDIGILQANYTKVAVLQTNDGVVAGRINIGKLVCNQNEQYPTFVSPVRTRSDSCDIFIGDMDARNYSGFAIDNETGLGNIVEVNRLKLRQAPNKPSYTLGTSARGVRVNNQQVRIGYADIKGIATSPFEFIGSYAQSLRIDGGNIGSFGGTGKLINITGTTGEIFVRDLNNNSGIGLFNHQQYVVPDWRDVANPFPVVTEGGRKAIKIPFCAAGSAFSVTIYANTAPAGGANYRRTKKLWVTQETGYASGVVTNIYAGVLGNSGLSTAFTPDIDHQVALNTVGGGAQAARVQSGEVVVSVPSNYDSVRFTVSQEM